MTDLFAGLDLGTSGVRLCVIDGNASVVAEHRIAFSETTRQTPEDWWSACTSLFAILDSRVRRDIVRLAIDGTSGTLLLLDTCGHPLVSPLFYNDHDPHFRYHDQSLVNYSDTVVRGLRLLDQVDTSDVLLTTQADFIKGKLCGNYQTSDYNNCYKLGYDSSMGDWPSYFSDFGICNAILPVVYAPGKVVGNVNPEVAAMLDLSIDLQLVAGTTDSIAAVIATGANRIGQAITSLGSTLVIKVITATPLSNEHFGIYSQPYGNNWLVGGASNCGAGILRRYFTDEQMVMLTQGIDIDNPTGLEYYPLTQTGERFPLNDADKKPCLEPRPADDVVFFQGLLESLSRIEKQGYDLLEQMGAPRVDEVITVGGGSKNTTWGQMRSQILGRPVSTAEQSEAAYGSALLAAKKEQGFRDK